MVLVAVLLLYQQSGYSEQANVDSPSRIVSLDLCTDWMLLKTASRSQVLAFSPLLYRFPANWVDDNLPVHDGSLEQILQLQPDLILTGEYNAITLRKRLLQLGLKVKVLPLPDSLQAIQQYEQYFHSILGHNSHEKIALTQFKDKNKTLLLLGANGIGTGTATLENDVIEKSGWTNYVQQQGYVNLDLEQLVSHPPDAVLWAAPHSNSLANLFASHRVLEQINDGQKWVSRDYWRWQCPGPWTYELIQEMAEWKKF